MYVYPFPDRVRKEKNSGTYHDYQIHDCFESLLKLLFILHKKTPDVKILLFKAHVQRNFDFVHGGYIEGGIFYEQ